MIAGELEQLGCGADLGTALGSLTLAGGLRIWPKISAQTVHIHAILTALRVLSCAAYLVTQRDYD